MVICNDFFITDLPALPCTGLRCPSEDARAVTYYFQIVDKPRCFVFIVWVREQEIFHLFKVIDFQVFNHTVSSPLQSLQ